jgi:hypothetical protein
MRGRLGAVVWGGDVDDVVGLLFVGTGDEGPGRAQGQGYRGEEDEYEQRGFSFEVHFFTFLILHSGFAVRGSDACIASGGRYCTRKRAKHPTNSNPS